MQQCSNQGSNAVFTTVAGVDKGEYLIPPIPGKPIFFSGWHQPVNGASGCGDFRFALIGINRLIRRKGDFDCQKIIIDSSAFTRISGLYKEFKSHLSTRKYARLLWYWKEVLGDRLVAAVTQDYMCEALVLANTKLTIADHQRVTILRYDNLCKLLDGSGIELIPVLQGYAPEEYVSHIHQYGDRLKHGAWVGVGSVCKRNANPSAIYEVLSAIKAVRPDLRLHGFGLKKESLKYVEVQNLLYSADSAAAGLQRGNGSNKYVESNNPKRALEYEAEIYQSFVHPKRLPVKQLSIPLSVVVAGVDESKRGNCFGPLVAVAYLIHEDKRQKLQQALAPKGAIRDSKLLGKAKRQSLLPLLRECGTWRIGYAKSSEIDSLGADAANFLAFKRAIAKLPIQPTKVLVDGNKRIPQLGIEQEAIPGGDKKELAIAAASILCKEWSDDLVERLGAKLPHNFAQHHGYNCDADLSRYGVGHRQFRRRWSSVKRVLLNKESNQMVASVERPITDVQANFTQMAQSSASFYANRDRVFPFEIIEVHPDLIELGLDTQCRSKESQEKISEWAEIMKAGEWDIDCVEPFHDYPELVADKNGRFIPLSHHRVQSAQQSQTTLKYKVWTQASLSAARIFAAASNPQKGSPWVPGDHQKRVFALMDNWTQMDADEKDKFIDALDGVIKGQQLTRLRNSRELSDYVIEKILTIPSRTVSNHRRAWECQRKVCESGIKVGDRVSVVSPLNTFAMGEMGAVADIDFKKAEIWVSWDGQPGKAPFPIPLAHIRKTDEPKPAILHFNQFLDLLVAIDANEWDKNKLIERQETGVKFEDYQARYSSLKTGYWFVSPNDEGLANLLEAVKNTRSQVQQVKAQSTPLAVFPEAEVVDEGPEVVTRLDEISGTTPEQYAKVETIIPQLKPLPYTEGEVVLARIPKECGAISGLKCLAEIRKVEQLRCIVYFGVFQVELAIDVPGLTKVTEEEYQEVKAMHDRIDKLCKYELDSVDRAMLEQLSRQTEYTSRAYQLLEDIERHYEGTEIRPVIEEFRS